MTEKWLPSREFSNYDVSDEGNVRNRKTGRVMKKIVNSNGYPTLSLYKDGLAHTRKVAEIVADEFLDEKRNGRVLSYKDGDRSNVRADNLMYKTKSEIARRGFEEGTRDASHRMKKIRDINTGEIYESIIACSRATGINKDSIGKSANGYHINIRGGHRFEAVED